ncbi:MAG: primase C-terminal domain-containing protein, partial [Acidobacteria bacterium]|nr:primase C-terminal domain-containing protein [Acidobacteriota bacterium]
GRHVVNRSRFASGCDTRSSEGYIVAAPSRIPEGTYAWDTDFHPLECEISEAPEWLLALVTAPSSRQGPSAPPDEFAALVAAGVDEGSRNSSLTRLAGYFLRRYVDPYVTLEMLQLWNRERCRPPLSERDVRTIVVSIAKKEARRREARNG